MNDKECLTVIKAANKLGLRVTRTRSFMCRSTHHVSRIYDSAGNQTIFDPYTRLGDAMLLVMYSDVSIHMTRDTFEVTTKCNGYHSRIELRSGSKKPNEYRIGAAILNAINFKAP